MTYDPVIRVVDLLGSRVQGRNGDSVKALCPSHDDRNPSLSVSRGEDGRALMHCHAGCTNEEITQKLGIEMSDLFPLSNGTEIEATYDYNDEEGRPLFQVVRYRPKDFRQRHMGPNGRWVWSAREIRKVPFHLDRLMEASPKQPVFVVEGEQDVHSLEKQGLVATTNPGGAGKWHLLDKETVKRAFEDRRVFVPPDNDEAGKRHAQEVAKALRGIASSVQILELPGLKTKGADVTDWIAAGHTREELLELAEGSRAQESSMPERLLEDSEGSRGGKQPLEIFKIAGRITETQHFAKDDGDGIYIYQGGYYAAGAQRTVRALVKGVLKDLRREGEWSSHKGEEVIKYIAADAPVLWPKPPLDRISVENGILEVETGRLLPHTHEFLSPIQLPIKYDPEARCPAIDRFSSEVFPGDAIDIAYEVAAFLMLPDTTIQKAVLLLGPGGNGKSIFCQLMLAFLGRRNVSGLALQKLESDRFAAARLVGKLANIAADLPNQDLASTATFKALTGGDMITGERKFQDSFDFEPYARLLFSANRPPASGDSSEGFFQRWLVVPFERSFRGTQEEVPRDELLAHLTTPAELSGLLNRALEALPRLRERGFTESESTREARECFREATDPISIWLDQNTLVDPEAMVAKDDLLRAYNDDASARGRSPETKTSFSLAVKRWKRGIEDAQRTWNGRERVRVWLGVGLRREANNQEGSLTSRGSRGFPHLYSPINRTREEDQEGDDEYRTSRQNCVNSVNPVMKGPDAGEDEELRI